MTLTKPTLGKYILSWPSDLPIMYLIGMQIASLHLVSGSMRTSIRHTMLHNIFKSRCTAGRDSLTYWYNLSFARGTPYQQVMKRSRLPYAKATANSIHLRVRNWFLQSIWGNWILIRNEASPKWTHCCWNILEKSSSGLESDRIPRPWMILQNFEISYLGQTVS